MNSVLQEIKLDILVEPEKMAPKRGIFGNIKFKSHQITVTHIASGDNITVAIDNENRIYNVPSEVYRFPKDFKVKQLVCGFEHALLLNKNGDVYAWGVGLRGQLGKDDLTEADEVPILVEAIAGIKITQIAAAGWHNAAISAFGDLYTWGYNSDGQLALGKLLPQEAKVYYTPQIAHLPQCECKEVKEEEESCSPVKVFSGARHLMLVMACGAVFAIGRNAYGQLGLKNNTVCDVVDTFQCVNLGYAGLDCEFFCGHSNTYIQHIDKTVDTSDKKAICDSP